MASYEIEVPLPPVTLSPNARYHFQRVGADKRTYRARCLLRFKAANIPPLKGRVTMHLTFYMARTIWGEPVYRPTDDDNAVAAFKAGRDALADAGIIADDNKKLLRTGDVVLHSKKADHGGRACIVVRLETEEGV